VHWKVRAFDSRQRLEIFPSSENVQGDFGDHPSSCSLDTSVFTLEVKRLEREAATSPPSAAEVKNGRCYIRVPPVCLNGLHREHCSCTARQRLVIMCCIYCTGNTVVVLPDSAWL